MGLFGSKLYVVKMSTEKFDAIVIGAGAAGLNVAGILNTLDLDVLLVEKNEANIGGDCLNSGCVPSKALIHVAKEVHAARRSRKFGINVSGDADMSAVRGYIEERQEIIRAHENKEYLEDKGIQVLIGEARFISEDEIEVSGSRYSAKYFVIATGSKPRRLEVPGIENVEVHTNETIFSLEELPKRLLVIGGGPIGLEIGQAYQMLGSEVTILERGEHFLPKEDSRVADVLFEKMKEMGVGVRFETEVKSFKSSNKAVVTTGEGREEVLEFDAVLGAIGRVVSFEGLGLEKAGIKTADGKIVLDRGLRTTNKRVFVCGDAAGGYQFTHASEMHAGVIARNMISPFKSKFNTDDLAWVTYTSPEIATFGVGEKALKDRGLKYEVIEQSFEYDDRAIIDSYRYGKALLFVSPEGLILGGSIVSPNASDMAELLILAKEHRIKLGDILDSVFPYPIRARVMRDISIQSKTKTLNKFNKKILRALFRF